MYIPSPWEFFVTTDQPVNLQWGSNNQLFGWKFTWGIWTSARALDVRLRLVLSQSWHLQVVFPPGFHGGIGMKFRCEHSESATKMRLRLE